MNPKSGAEAQTSLTQAQALAYGLPLLPLYFLYGPIAILQGIYAKHFGLALTTIATVLFVARLFDAVSDPIIGYCADRYHARRGNLKPFVISGGVLFIVASWFLYVPPANVSGGYFLVCFLAFYLAYTLFEIPHLAWGSQLASDCREKNKVYGLRSFFTFFGTLLFFAMPLLPWFETNEFTPDTLKWSVMAAGLLMLPMLFISIRTVPNGASISPKALNEGDQRGNKENLKRVLRAIVTNKPLMILTAAHICTGFGSGMWIMLLFIYVDAYLGLGAQFALAYTVSFAVSMVALKFWYQLANHWGKQAAWVVGMVLVIMGLMATGVLVTGRTSWLELLLCMTLIFSGFACFNLMVPSLLSDIVDYGTWKFGVDRAGTYFSLFTFVNKSVGALGGALALAIAGWVGFDPTETIHNDAAVSGVRFAIAWIPALFILLSIFFIARIPITAHRHGIIRRRLDARVTRVARAIKNRALSNDQAVISGKRTPAT